MSESKFYHFTPAGLFYGVKSADDAMAAQQEGGFIWLNYYKPGKNELMALIGALGIHPLAIEDCFDTNQVPKIEHFHGNTFIIFNAFTYTENELFVDEINLFIGKNFLITVSGINSDKRKPLDGAVKILENDPGLATSGPAFLMHVVLDGIVDDKFKAFDALEDELEATEDKVMKETVSFDPADMMRLRKDLVTLRKSLFHEREILQKICRMDCPYVPEKAIFHYRDIYDHLAKYFELTETYRETVTSLMELYTSLLNNHITKMSNRTNNSVRRLTLIATIFMPLTLLASIGGMSEWTMMTGGASNWKIAYPLFLLGMLIIAVINYFIIRRLEKRNGRKDED